MSNHFPYIAAHVSTKGDIEQILSTYIMNIRYLIIIISINDEIQFYVTNTRECFIDI